ncbi:PREDICTED: uncharacterized protein LOC109166435 [Ipomoea nil]|uniref:uncharacterized protein LOC109166435 n=1 Tax=Ipomoea nil TaxID=35883 RepID=UPI000900C997|nr:PREDICTED: uncharacterized protein LOC109166435 [Ipomoea nil]
MTIETSEVIRYLKILLISAGAVSVSMAMRAGVPVLVHDLSAVWTGFTARLKPLYLYVAINVIIVTIVLASRFQRESIEDDETQLHPREFRRLLVTARTPPSPDLNRLVAVAQLELKPDFEPEVNGSIVAVSEDDGGAGEYSNFAVVAPPLGDETGLFRWAAAEKLSLADQKPPPKAGLEGLRLPARPKQHETLENTWRMITERNHLLTPAIQLRRSDSFENASADENENHAPPYPRPQDRDALKSRTFKDRTNYDSPKAAALLPPVKARKEPSLSQDELNRRVEAFIKKFNEEMRLQREQSIQQHMEMINRGAY